MPLLADAVESASRVAFLGGAEDGLSAAAMRAQPRAAHPDEPGTDSLNVATAAAVAFTNNPPGQGGNENRLLSR